MDASFALPLARLRRTPRAWIPVAAWVVVSLGAALALRRPGASAVEGALASIFGGLALPLLAFTVVGAALGSDGLGRSTRGLVAFGASPERLAFATVAVGVVASAVLSSIVGAAVVALAHGPADPPLARDALTCLWVSGLGGAAYAALFAFGSSFGSRGGGRLIVLGLDWLLGGETVVGVLTPRAHVRSLLGGEAVAMLPGRQSAAGLVLLTLLFAALAVRRARSR